MPGSNGIHPDHNDQSPTEQILHDHIVDLVADRLERDERFEVLKNKSSSYENAIETKAGTQLYPDIVCLEDGKITSLCEVETPGTVANHSIPKWQEYSSLIGVDFLLIVPETELERAHELIALHHVDCQDILAYEAREV